MYYQSLPLNFKKTMIIQNLFKSILLKHILFIYYFLFIFIPVNLFMLLKLFSKSLNYENYYFDFSTMTLISLYGIIIFSIKLTNPINFRFFLNIILCNKDYIKEFESSLNNENDIYMNNIYMNNLHQNLTDKKKNDMNMHLNELTYGIINESQDEKKTSFDFSKNSSIKIDIKEKKKGKF